MTAQPMPVSDEEIQRQIDREVPLPAFPGTQWDPKSGPGSWLVCKNCGRDYNSHGGNGSHLTCPASEEAWAHCRRERSLRYDKARGELFLRDFKRLSVEGRTKLLAELRAHVCLQCGGNAPEEQCCVRRAILDVQPL